MMKAVILAGGKGRRISEESLSRPKPMVEIGNQPLLWHVMKIYSAHNITDFVICCGYKGHMIKEFFINYYLRTSDVTVDLRHNTLEVHRNRCEPWRITLVDTGEETMTGGRIKRVQDFIDDEPFCLAYGDGVSDIDISRLIEFHRVQSREHNVLVTVTAVQIPGRFGTFQLTENTDHITAFREKPHGKEGEIWINGGFFVVNPQALSYIDGDHSVWEREPLEHLAHEGRLAAFRHKGFWQPMDTLQDKLSLEGLWQSGMVPWKT